MISDIDKDLQRLDAFYPNIDWSIAEPSVAVERDFGDGIILIGERGPKRKDFFILATDKNKLKWGHVIANYLNGTVGEEY